MTRDKKAIWRLIDGSNSMILSLFCLCADSREIYPAVFYNDFMSIVSESAKPLKKIRAALSYLSMSEEALSLKNKISVSAAHICNLRRINGPLPDAAAGKILGQCRELCDSLETLTNTAIERYIENDRR